MRMIRFQQQWTSADGAAAQATEVFLDFDPVRPPCPACDASPELGDRPTRLPDEPKSSVSERNGANF